LLHSLHLHKQLWTHRPPLFFGLDHFISSHKTPNCKEEEREETTLSNDPRYGVKISPTLNDLKALGDRQMLITQLLDCLLQRSTPPLNE
jgi:hypothetical protein